MTNYPNTRRVRDWGNLIGGALLLVALALPVLIWLMPPAHSAPYAGESYSAVMPPCQQEDGSGQDGCVWRANVYGNGQGRSFLTWADGTVEYVSHHRARRIVRAWRNQECDRVTRRDWVCPRSAWNFTR